MYIMLRKKIIGFIFFLLPVITLAVLPHKTTSVLSAGRWYKIAVAKTGINRITFSDLQAMGINPGSIDIAKIRLYGNGSGMLSEINSAPRFDDLREIAVLVDDGGDGHFDAADYILFYGEGADKWTFEGFNRYFSHQRNLYSDSTYYFLNFDQGQGRRVQQLQTLPAAPNNFSAPPAARIVRESTCEETLRAIRAGIFALMSPVMIFTSGR